MIQIKKRTFSGAAVALTLALTLLSAATAYSATVATTRNDFALPGTQPSTVNDTFATPDQCASCHSDYGSDAIEPHRSWQSSMKANAGRDPLMWAAHAIAQQDASASGETCLRCHLPKGWLEGRSIPEDGTLMTAEDREGVQCSVCHRLVDPVADPGNPTEDSAILAALSQPVTTVGGAQMVVDPDQRLRGPLDVVADLGFNPHSAFDDTLVSPYHERAELCGTCHNVANPMFTRDMAGDYQPNTLDTPGDPALGFPEQSTYDEWLASEYATTGVDAPQFGGTEAVVSTCQNCHMPAVVGNAASFGPTRTDVPLHSFAGANTFVPSVLASHPTFGSEVDADVLADGVDFATDMLRRAATLTASIDAGVLSVRVTNETGHKLPTGYPEGRRMWLHVRAYDEDGNVVYESGSYDLATAELAGHNALMVDPDYDPDLQVWEAVHGLDATWAATLGMAAGPSPHLMLVNVREKDNRIPPRGFTNAAYEAFDGEPIGQAFADGQYWDDIDYPVGMDAVSADVTLYYQTTTKEYVEFLNDENVTNGAGTILFDLWDQINQSEPVAMARNYVEPDARVVAKCQKSVAKAQGKYLKAYLKGWRRCYDLEGSGDPCDDAGVIADLAEAEAKLRTAVGGSKDKRCAGANLQPSTLGHPAYCPAPCADLLVFDFSGVADCSLCLAEAAADAALSSGYGAAPTDLPDAVAVGDEQKCLKLLSGAAVKQLGKTLKTLELCERDNSLGSNLPELDCAADPSGKIEAAAAKAAKKIGKCADYSALDGCATAGDAAAVAQCVSDAIDAVAASYPALAYP